MREGNEARSAFLLYLVCLSTFFASLMQNMYSPILPLLRDSFGVSLSMVNLSVSLFIFIVAVMQIVIGSVIDVKGARAVLIPGLVLTIAASIGCAVTDNFALFLVCRALQAFGTAAIPLIAAATIGRLFQGSQRGSAMGTYQMLLSLAPAVAPVLGGWIGERYSYPGIFWFLAGVSILLLAANGIYFPQDKGTDEKKVRLRDLFAQYAVIMKNKVSKGIFALAFLYFFIYFEILVYLPALLTDHYQVSLQIVGLLYLPMALSTIAGTMIFKAIQAKLPHRALAAGGSVLAAASMLLFAATESVSLIGLSAALVMYGISGGVLTPLFATMISNEFEAQRGSALGLFNFIRYVGMAAGPITGGWLLAWLSATAVFALFGILVAAVAWLALGRLRAAESLRVEK
ncbi:MFS transporter [Paenibacillus thiaminolyticus]|uniref:MFS transporter n=1 Tax=Paenibacillus thiaminolyticus TaxID=49283 RepID=UPI00254288F6|nr:MFS transporter [Paenibacillus thiaminolyticus]WII38253.1 MFS transporter [Paenibacillus thiaminolyticus]